MFYPILCAAAREVAEDFTDYTAEVVETSLRVRLILTSKDSDYEDPPEAWHWAKAVAASIKSANPGVSAFDGRWYKTTTDATIIELTWWMQQPDVRVVGG